MAFKPLLIDLAYDSVAEYDMSNLKTETKSETREESGSGIMSVISGLWGSK